MKRFTASTVQNTGDKPVKRNITVQTDPLFIDNIRRASATVDGIPYCLIKQDNLIKTMEEYVCMKNALNNGEPEQQRIDDADVKEIASMQRELDALYYMLFHLASFAKGNGDGYALLASSDDVVNHHIRILYNFIKEHRK